MKTVSRKILYLMACAALLVLPASTAFATPISSGDPSTRLMQAELQNSPDSLMTGVQVRPVAISYNNCSHLYAVQTDDTLADVARVSATTQEFVLSRNDLDSGDDIYAGLVLCLEDGNGGAGIPVTGGKRSGVEVSRVSTDQTVTVRGIDFPDGVALNVYMFQQGVSNPNVAYLGAITVPSGGTFSRQLQIPTELRAFRNLVIRFRNPDENVSATATFINADVERVTPAECAEYYTVHSGDVLGSIAQDVNVSVEQLVQLNNLLNANIVFPGQLLCIARK